MVDYLTKKITNLRDPLKRTILRRVKYVNYLFSYSCRENFSYLRIVVVTH